MTVISWYRTEEFYFVKFAPWGVSHYAVSHGTCDAVDKLIMAIGDVTLDSKDAIKKAQKAYDKLNSNAKSKVKNYHTLVKAKKKLEKLEKKNGE